MSFTIDKRLDADHAEATLTYSKLATSHCDASNDDVRGEVIRTYRLQRVGQHEVQGRVAERVQATLVSERRTGEANVSPGTFCMSKGELPHDVAACELPDVPKLDKTVLALTDDGLLVGFHARGIVPDAADRATYETADGYESMFDPFVIYRRVTH